MDAKKATILIFQIVAGLFSSVLLADDGDIKLLVPASCSANDQTTAAPPLRTLKDIVHDYRHSVIFIRYGGDRDTGTGFIVSKDGYVLTARHVVHKTAQAADAKTPTDSDVIIRGRLYDADGGQEVLLDPVPIDSGVDLALLHIRDTGNSWTPIPVGATGYVSGLQGGDTVYDLGFDGDRKWGNLPGLIDMKGGPNGYWTAHMGTTFGFSGSPVFDGYGIVVAVVSSGTSPIPGVPASVTGIIPMSMATTYLQAAAVQPSNGPSVPAQTCSRQTTVLKPDCDPCAFGPSGGPPNGQFCGGRFAEYWGVALKSRGLINGDELSKTGRRIENLRLFRMAMKCGLIMESIILQGPPPPTFQGENPNQYNQRVQQAKQQASEDINRARDDVASAEAALASLGDNQLKFEDARYLTPDVYKSRYPNCCLWSPWMPLASPGRMQYPEQ